MAMLATRNVSKVKYISLCIISYHGAFKVRCGGGWVVR